MIGLCKRKRLLRPHNKAIQHNATCALNKEVASLNAEEQCLFEIGATLGPAITRYLSYVDLHSRTSGRPVYFLSSEASTLIHLSEILCSKNELHALLSLNRLSALRQFIYLGITEVQTHDLAPLFGLLFAGDKKIGFTNILERIGIETKDLPWPVDMYTELPRSIQLESISKLFANKPQLIQSLRGVHEQVLQELEQDDFFDKKEVLVTDVGWNATIQYLLQGSMMWLKKDTDMQGIYMGRNCTKSTPPLPQDKAHGVLFQSEEEKLGSELLVEEIWEYALCNAQDEKREWIVKGIEHSARFYMSHVESAPDFAFECLYPELHRLFCKPNRLQMKLLGSIEHKEGLGNDYTQKIIQQTYSRLGLLKTFFFDPPLFQSHYKNQFWKRGFLSWYRLRFLKPFMGLHKQLAILLTQDEEKE
jgi:hypothetical protein